MTNADTALISHLNNYAQDVLENMSEAFFLLDREFRVLDVNSAAIALDGRPKEEILGRTLWELAPDVEESELGSLFKRVMASRQSETSTHHQQWEDGRAAWLKTRIVPVEAGVAAFYRDVTAANCQLKKRCARPVGGSTQF